MVPEVSINSGTPTIYLSLDVIILVSGAKDFYEDYKRRKSDKKEIITDHTLKVHQDEIIQAYILFLRSIKKEGIFYVETKLLDGKQIQNKKMYMLIIQTQNIKILLHIYQSLQEKQQHLISKFHQQIQINFYQENVIQQMEKYIFFQIMMIRQEQKEVNQKFQCKNLCL
ncbi:unnamed protein product [Paramecium sonneborni]|uniref:Uncharacterized protein n=1 Tax=Paramecium sonneborni TaxID=65129 RepID=A0A8S1RQ58_9CILI|nr:unnamed protein product [Paramecium sonneborni]